MTLVVPNVAEVDNLNLFLNRALVLKLYSNDKTPAEGDTVASYTEVSGGGYASKSLTFATWAITSGDPTVALYTAQDFEFTGSTNAPGTVFGYFIVVGSLLLWAERFPAGVLPFSPINGSLIKVTPRFEAS